MTNNIIYGSSYLKLHPKSLKHTVLKISKKICEIRENSYFDAIAVCGVSGISIGFPVSYKTEIPVVVVRKEKEFSHGRRLEACDIDIKKYFILDDLISTGATVKYIMTAIAKHSVDLWKPVPVCVGIGLYHTELTGYKSYVDDQNCFQIRGMQYMNQSPPKVYDL